MSQSETGYWVHRPPIGYPATWGVQTREPTHAYTADRGPAEPRKVCTDVKCPHGCYRLDDKGRPRYRYSER